MITEDQILGNFNAGVQTRSSLKIFVQICHFFLKVNLKTLKSRI